MKTVMSVLVVLAVAYFAYQYIASSAHGKTTGRLRDILENPNDQSGIAEYLGIDPTIVRLVWALLVFGWGTGLLAYIVCAFVLPEE